VVWSVVFGSGQLWSEVVSSVWKWSDVVNSDHFVPKGQSILTTCFHLLTLKKISWIHPPSSNLCIFPNAYPIPLSSKMQYVLSDAEFAYLEELKKTLRSWGIIFEKFKLQFKDCPVKTQGKLQRCYGYLKGKLKKEPGVASSPIGSDGRQAQTRKRKTSTALPVNDSVEASSPTDGEPSSTDGEPRKKKKKHRLHSRRMTQLRHLLPRTENLLPRTENLVRKKKTHRLHSRRMTQLRHLLPQTMKKQYCKH
jgi:hypothetical protein